MTNVQSQMIKIALNRNDVVLAVKLIIMANVESGNMVYIPNVQADAIKSGITAHQVAGALSALTKQGFYTPDSALFGRIK